ncbi:MAG TPA: tRNA (adenosine(37)-N6)-threonylcarbamoyltransferase complex dimerization subunit type 1 TsaB [Cyanobium sp.]|nr:tRNA (adenosine(37)-N6)-threonylcarbamoyltransferase complex dimerization subunit type 1 TsaB [Cyanobium sp.]
MSGDWILALHSSCDTLGVGLQRLGASGTPTLAAFPLGRALSNRLIDCVETVLPASQWPGLGRLAVATGPGGFTGTRLTVVFARTLAQQLGLPLDAISSFHLIARRLITAQDTAAQDTLAQDTPAPFWLVQDLPRRGTVAGHYAPDPEALGGVAELQPPRLFTSFAACPRFPACSLIPEDVAELLAFSQAAAAAGRSAPWQTVLPLYPTSPVQGGGA